MDPGNKRVILAALFANLGIAVAKFIGWALTGASSMLAEGVHSVADTTNQVLLLWGHAAARRAPSPSHTFGYGRERYFWAFVVSMVIFSLGSLFAIYKGVEKLRHPQDLTDPLWALCILALGLLLEGWSFRTAVVEARPHKGVRSWWAFIRTTKNPELPVVLLEDLGALIGLTLAMLGVGLSMISGDPRFDAVGSISIGLLLGAIAILLAHEMKSLLIGESASPEHVELIREAALSHPCVRRVIHLRTQHLAADELLVGAKLEFDSDLDFNALSDAIDEVEQEIRRRLRFRAVVYIEPDVYDPAEAAPPSSDPH
ncbi:MAG: cation diffusion facilitator family transporter [Myxococcota bacterium]